MKKLFTVLLAAMFAGASFSAIAQPKEEKKKMDAKKDGKKDDKKKGGGK